MYQAVRTGFIVTISALSSGAGAQSFTPIINPADPSMWTWGVDISRDGRTVVGHIGEADANSFFLPSGAFRWSLAGGFEDLRQPSDFPFQRMTVRGASSDAGVIAGTYTPAPGSATEGFEYSEIDGYAAIGTVPGVSVFWPENVSGNGSLIVGSNRSSNLSTAAISRNGVVQELGFLSSPNPFFDTSTAQDATQDGAVVVGQSSTTESLRVPYIWTETDGMRQITSFETASAQRISRNGEWVIGYSSDGNTSFGEAFIWSESAGDRLLGFIPGEGEHSSYAKGVSDDGRVVVGEANIGGFGIPWQAYIWTEKDGMQNLRTLLENDYGADLAGWQLIEATSVSGDGTTITGRAIDPDGVRRAFVAVIPAPSGAALLCMVPLLAHRRRRDISAAMKD